MRYSISELNQLSQEAFVEVLGEIFEDSPWVAQNAEIKRPFADLASLHQAMVEVVEQASLEDQLRLIRLHPDLGNKVKMSAASVKEQAGAGLNQLTAEEYVRFGQLNEAYKTKFGFPFIIAVKQHSKESILNTFEFRLNNTAEAEVEQALKEIAQIASFRLGEIIETEFDKTTSNS